MNLRTLAKQTAMLSGTHFLVRVMGFGLRIWLSRSLGAQAMGLVELAQSAQMLLITPVTSGLPAAMSRMCAQAGGAKRVRIARVGAALALAVSLPLALVGFALREPIALWLGDVRTMPALLFCLPCIPVLGLSCALNGYYYGCGKPLPPALSEIVEQVVRLLLCIRLVHGLRGWPMTLRAAIPAAASLMGETAGLLLMLLLASRALLFACGAGSRRAILSELLALSLPLTGMRLFSSLMRTVSTTLLPQMLMRSGLPRTEALTQLGMFSGMLMPVLMLPSFVTCSLSMVCAPELARRQAAGRPYRHLMQRILVLTLAVGLIAMAVVFAAAPLFADTLYRQAELRPLIRGSCALVPVMALTHVAGGLMNGLGLQKKSLSITLKTNVLSTLLMIVLAAQPGLGLRGAILAMGAGQLLTLALSLRALTPSSKQR